MLLIGLDRHLGQQFRVRVRLREYKSKFHTTYCFLMASFKVYKIDETAPSTCVQVLGIIESESQGNYVGLLMG